MNKLMNLTLMSALLFTSVGASASEGIQQIALNVQEKQSLVRFLQSRIQKHEGMTKDQIVTDIQDTLERNHQALADSKKVDSAGLSNFDRQKDQYLDQLSQISDKDTVVALEKAQLQEVLSSDNILFGVTKSLMADANSWDGASGEEVLIIFTVPIDLAVLPFEFIASAVTGF